MHKITFQGAVLFQLNSVEELNTFLANRLQDGLIYALEDTMGNVLTFGLCGRSGFLNFVDKTGNPPYYSSVNDRHVEFGSIIFDCGEPTEISRQNCVSVDNVKDALRFFLKTGKLTNEIRWEVD